MRKTIYCLRKQISSDDEIAIYTARVQPFLIGFLQNHTDDEYIEEFRRRMQEAGLEIFFKQPVHDSPHVRRTIKERYPGYQILWAEDIGLEQFGRRIRNMFGRTCQSCGNRFTPRKSNHIYCSETCKNKARYKREGREIPKKRKFCEMCSEEMKKRAGSRTCSSQCRAALSHRKKLAFR